MFQSWPNKSGLTMTLRGMLPELADEHRPAVETLIVAVAQRDAEWIQTKLEGLEQWLKENGY